MAKSKLSELEKKIAALPDKKMKRKNWTMAEDAMILKYAESKGFSALGEIFGISSSAIHTRYHFLKRQIGGGK